MLFTLHTHVHTHISSLSSPLSLDTGLLTYLATANSAAVNTVVHCFCEVLISFLVNTHPEEGSLCHMAVLF